MAGSLFCVVVSLATHARTARSRNHPPRHRAACDGTGDHAVLRARATAAVAGGSALARWAEGQRIRAVHRRAKYILVELEKGHLLVHLGMSGSLRVLPVAHRARDARPFRPGDGLRLAGALQRSAALWQPDAPDRDPGEHPLLRHLAPEPLDDAFDADYLFKVIRKRSVAIKLAIMNSQLVVGVGQHLRQRIPVPCRDPAGARGPSH